MVCSFILDKRKHRDSLPALSFVGSMKICSKIVSGNAKMKWLV